MSAIGLGMDLLLGVLLVAALVFGYRLERKLRALRQGQESFAQAVRELDGAARRAEAGLATLREATDEAHDSLHDRILKARELKQQLDAQIARAERMPAPAPRSEPAAPSVERLRPAAFAQAAAPSPGQSFAPPRPDRAPDPVRARRFDEELFESAGDRP